MFPFQMIVRCDVRKNVSLCPRMPVVRSLMLIVMRQDQIEVMAVCANDDLVVMAVPVGEQHGNDQCGLKTASQLKTQDQPPGKPVNASAGHQHFFVH